MNQQPRIETFGPIELIGVALFGNPKTTSFHSAWEFFGTIADDSSISRIGKDMYGLQIYHPMFPEKFELTYMACVEKEPNIDIPIRMLSKRIPKCKYVVQKVEGGVMEFDDALIYLYQTYIPKNGFSIAMPIDFEKYCNVKNNESIPDDLEIWIPIKY